MPFSVDSDSDSELSVDEHSSSYASSHSSDSEDDDIDVKPKWNNERPPVHSTPKGKWALILNLNMCQSVVNINQQKSTLEYSKYDLNMNVVMKINPCTVMKHI